jgi:dinuclear metal center YbgI/SA1388 family protein
MDRLAPCNWAEEGDNVGLLVGDPGAEVSAVLVSLDVDEKVVDRAIAHKANLIITHHPPIFRPLKSLRYDLPSGSLLRKLIKNNIMVYVAHTNLDCASLGVSAQLAKSLGLLDTEPLKAVGVDRMFKLVTFVPTEHTKTILNAMADAGAGWIGNYSHCSFRLLGTGTFLPREEANPFIGLAGRLEEVEEHRLETILPENLLEKVVAAMKKAHPYEEVAYDIYPLHQPATSWGFGKIGRLPAPVPLMAFVEKVKQTLGVKVIKLSGEREGLVTKVAVCGGAGASLIHAAFNKGADVLVTGDLKYHEAREAIALKLPVLDAGHLATEQVIIPALTQLLRSELEKSGETVKIDAVEDAIEPWAYF